MRALGLLLAALMLAGCAALESVPEDWRQPLAEGRYEDALARLEALSRQYPDHRELRGQYFRQRELAVARLTARGDALLGAWQIDAATASYRRAAALDPASRRALAGQEEAAAEHRHLDSVREAEELIRRGNPALAEARLRLVLAERPGHAAAGTLLRNLEAERAPPEIPPGLRTPFAKPITLEFRDTPLKNVFEVIARTSGVNFAFDKDVRADTRVTLFVRNTTVDEVVRLILATNQLERKILNDNSVLIYPHTAAKLKDYQELVIRNFFLTNVDVKQAQGVLRAMTKTRDVFADEKLNLLVVKDTPEAVRLAERIIASIDVAEPEAVLDVEVLEVSSSKLSELGLRFPEQLAYGVLGAGGAAAPASAEIRDSSLRFSIANPVVIANLRAQDGRSNILANPSIRVRSRDKAKVHIGEKLPVFTTTSTANVGVSASVSYLDVGLKLEVEPQVYLDREVAIKISLEVSSIVREVSGPSGTLAYQVGTRSASTTLRIRDGETQILAGLISDEERRSANRVPGLGELPLIGRLFSNQRDDRVRTEIVLLITPRVVRSIPRPELIAAAMPSGTESAVGAAQLRLKPASALSLSSAGGAVPGGQPRVASPPPRAGAQAPAAPDVGPAAVAPSPPAAATPVAGPPRLEMSGPSDIAVGAVAAFQLRLSGAAGLRAARVQLQFDPALFESDAAGNAGLVSVNLAPVADGAAGQVGLRARAQGVTRVQAVDARATDAQGRELALELPPSSEIAVRP